MEVTEYCTESRNQNECHESSMVSSAIHPHDSTADRLCPAQSAESIMLRISSKRSKSKIWKHAFYLMYITFVPPVKSKFLKSAPSLVRTICVR